MREYATAPEVNIYGDPGFTFPYVPSHLHHMTFELVKNSLRAVNDKFDDSDDEPPAIKVVIAEGEEDITVKVCYCGVQCFLVYRLHQFLRKLSVHQIVLIQKHQCSQSPLTEFSIWWS